MDLSESLSDGLILEKDRRDLSSTGIYGSALREYHSVATDKTGSLYRATLWSKIAPSGNMYRYLAVCAEARTHSCDLWEQVADIAYQHRVLLGGQDSLQEDREAALIDALKRTQVHGRPRTEREHMLGEEAASRTGFMPLEVFLDVPRPRRFGSLILPSHELMWRYARHRSMVALVGIVQVGVPVIIAWDEYGHLSLKLQRDDNMKEVFLSRVQCLGNTSEEICHTLAGVALLTIFILIIHSYVDDQHRNSRKTGVLPQNRFWYIVGNLINLWCGWATCIAIPFIFWNEDRARGIVMDSLTLLFVFCLDDFAGYAGMYMQQSEYCFQRGAAWHVAMLSQCPVRVADLINPLAKHVDELWQIRFSDAGSLQVCTGDQLAAWNAPACKRRLQPALGLESSPLTQAPPGVSAEEDLGSLSFEYSTSEGHFDILPRFDTRIMLLLWKTTGWMLSFVQIGMPLFWMVMNKRCEDGV